MSLSSLEQFLKQRLQQPLPGSQAHDPMRANPVGNTIPNFSHKLPPKPGSVLILLYESGGIIRFPLIKRPEYLGAHSGQISFPGGKAEPDEDVIQTALREAHEEIYGSRREPGVRCWRQSAHHGNPSAQQTEALETCGNY